MLSSEVSLQHKAHHNAATTGTRMAQKLWSLGTFSIVVLCLTCVCLTCACPSYAAANLQSNHAINIWHTMDDGLSIASFDLKKTPSGQTSANSTLNASLSAKKPALVAIRIDPKLWKFSAHCASANNKKALSIRQWAEQEDLTLAINASMYLPDGMTSTGYLQAGEHLNNSRIGSKLGAFFVANPIGTTLPSVALLDKSTHAYESLIPSYSIVVQNFRLISPDRRILWKTGGARHSIAAIGQDAQGRILFLHSAKPMTPHEFAAVLLALPLNVCNVMYVEGGPESALLLRTPDVTKVWIGKLRPELLGFGSTNVPLPNIIGVRKK